MGGYDVKNLPSNLQPIAFLVGKWRSEHGGKAVFPTIPVFTYGEELDFSLTDEKQSGVPALNYTAFAWGINEKNELHSEYGFVTVRPGSRDVALNTVMNNGFVTVEEGKVEGRNIRFRLQDIGRISFSRDLPVHDVIRHWTLLDSDTLEARLEMETLTHGLQEHTFIRYKKIYP
uniref:THAP4-like heme-binding beta-barrel domain-containing protein n=1 Tax=Plectus sambesii TaxID=2011161 RepID=A0A914WAZ9_9BILA